MRQEFEMLLSHMVAVTTGAAALIATALVAYSHHQIRAGTTWLLAPLTEWLPWNHSKYRRLLADRSGAGLISLWTIAEVRITSRDGARATYKKTSEYEIRAASLSEYREGVTVEGTATDFSTVSGRIIETIREHGFYVSRIDLANVLHRGARFQNTYMVRLLGSFRQHEEHWTQEIAVPTEHLTLRVVFPSSRSPSLLRCKILDGLVETQVPTSAHVTQFDNCSAANWEIPQPALGAIYKLEWCW